MNADDCFTHTEADARRFADHFADPPHDVRPTLAEVQRAEREPPEPPMRLHGRTVVGTQADRLNHLAYDGVKTVCGITYRWKVVRSPRAVCPTCVENAAMP